MFAFRDTADLGPGNRVEIGFTDASVDLQSRPHKLEGFAEALGAVETVAGLTFARLNQVHGDVVVDIDETWPAGSRESGDVPVADALVTKRRDVGLMIRVADCVPIVLADPVGGVIGAVHAGRKGVSLDIVGRAVDRMRVLGASDLRAWVGPHVCGRCYEVPEEMRSEIAALVPQTRSETSWGTPSLDLGAGVLAQLEAAGVSSARVTTINRCTLEDDQLHSHRRDGEKSGRFAGLVWFS